MRAGLVALAVVVVLVVGVVVWAIGVQNRLVGLEQDVNEKWAQVQNVYQRRADLLPNLGETVKGFAAQQRTVLTEGTQARASATTLNPTPRGPNNPPPRATLPAARTKPLPA